MYKLRFAKPALKIYLKLPKNLQQIFDEKLARLVESPYGSGNDVKRLQGLDNSYRLRIGHWRLIYKLYNDTLVLQVIKIGLRKEVYR